MRYVVPCFAGRRWKKVYSVFQIAIEIRYLELKFNILNLTEGQ